MTLGFLDGVESYLHRIFAFGLRVYRHTYLFAEHFKLLDSGRTINVASHEQRTFALFVLELVGKFAGESGLTRTLKTRHKNNGRFSLDVERCLFATHQKSKFIVHDFHHQLAWVDRSDYILTESLFLNGVGESFGYCIVNVGIKQSAAHFLHGLCHIDFGNLAFAF